MRQQRSPGTQAGVVLITAVLIVAIIATIATHLSIGQQVWLRQTENLNGRAQAESLRQGALGWIATLLVRDSKDTSNGSIDYLGELWAGTIPPLPTDGGTISVSITDAQSFFNLNNLVRINGQQHDDHVSAFRRLLISQTLDPSLANALVDWIDTDSNSLSGGGENVDYLARTPSYRVADQKLTSFDELRLVKGFTPAVIKTLRQFATVLPKDGTTINVNTAKPEVLSVLFPVPPGNTLNTALEERETKPFKATGDFQQKLPAGVTPLAGSIDVKTEYFLVNISIRIGRFERRSEALIHRPYNKPASVMWQRLNPTLPDPKKNEQS